MSITTRWDDDAQTRILIHLGRGWRWDDLRQAIQAADDLIVSVSHTVNILIDIRQAGTLPADFMSVAGELLSSGSARPNEGHKVIVGANWLLQMAYKTFLGVYGSQMKNRPLRFADTLEQARQMSG